MSDGKQLRYEVRLGDGVLRGDVAEMAAELRDLDVVLSAKGDPSVRQGSRVLLLPPRAAWRFASQWRATRTRIEAFGREVEGVRVEGTRDDLELVAECVALEGVDVASARLFAGALGLEGAPLPERSVVVLLSVRSRSHDAMTVALRLASMKEDDGDRSRPRERSAAHPDPRPPGAPAPYGIPFLTASPIVGGSVTPGVGACAYAVSDGLLDDLRKRVNKVLGTLGTVELRPDGPFPGQIVVPWLERLDALKLSHGGKEVVLRDELLNTLVLAFAGARLAGTEIMPDPADPILLAFAGMASMDLQVRAGAYLACYGTAGIAVKLKDFHRETELVVLDVGHLALEVDLGGSWIQSLKTGMRGLEASIVVGDVRVTGGYSIVPAGTPAAVLLSIATGGVFALLATNGGPFECHLRDATLDLRLVPTAGGITWTLEVEKITGRLEAAAATGLVNLPFAALASAVGLLLGLFELDLTGALRSAIQGKTIDLPWRVNHRGAPELLTTAGVVVADAGIGLMGALVPIVPQPWRGLPLKSDDRVVYWFTQEFMRAWIAAICGGDLPIRNEIEPSELDPKVVKLPPLPNAPSPPHRTFEEILGHVRTSLGASSPYPVGGPILPPPASTVVLKARLDIDVLDVELVPKSDVAVRWKARSTFVLQTLQVDYRIGAQFIPEQCERKPWPIGKRPIDPIDPIDPFETLGSMGGGRPSFDYGFGQPIGELPLCNPPHVQIIWVPAEKVLKELLNLGFEHQLDIQLGIAGISGLGGLVCPPAGLHAPGPLVSSATVHTLDAALGNPQDVQAEVERVVNAFVASHLAHLLDAKAAIQSRFEVPSSFGVPLIAFGQAAQSAFSYRKLGVNLFWGVDIEENVSSLIP